MKLVGVLFIIIWVRATWPRLRIDQILAFAWKGLFELTLVNLIAMAILLAVWPEPTTGQLWIMGAINWGVFLIAVYGVGRLLGPPKRRTNRIGNESVNSTGAEKEGHHHMEKI